MSKIEIDGKEVEFTDQRNVLQVALDHGLEVPHYCYHPGLSVAGACRMCLVEVEGMGGVQISCNLAPKEGMKVKTNSQYIKDAVKWSLEFHLVNHPLDCPICDQAGECGLQEYYMKFGQYKSEMVFPKVKKEKAVNLGKIMLDQERCILCSRCVRFCAEVAKQPELTFKQRGDHTELSTFDGEPMKSNYALNNVDICPVGALTSKDFRFKQRVWFLKSFDTICPGCSTGCNIKIDYSANRLYRIRPRYNAAINQYWMCDFGRLCYKYVNAEGRLSSPIKQSGGVSAFISWEEVLTEISGSLVEVIREYGENGVGALITPQVTCEDAFTWYHFFVEGLNTESVFHHVDFGLLKRKEAIDGILIREDKNPNSNGLYEIARYFGFERKGVEALHKVLRKGELKCLLVVAPENREAYPNFGDFLGNLGGGLESLILLTSDKYAAAKNDTFYLPILTYAEKEGTFVNFAGMAQKIFPGPQVVPEARGIPEILWELSQKMKVKTYDANGLFKRLNQLFYPQ